nr:hypothetical protein [Tanacetum cinerariifolium]
MDYRLVYSSYPSMLEGYTDVSWISNTKDNSSTSSYVFLLDAAGKEAEWLKNLLLEILLWVKPISPISIRCDSPATLPKSYSQMYNGKYRHLGEDCWKFSSIVKVSSYRYLGMEVQSIHPEVIEHPDSDSGLKGIHVSNEVLRSLMKFKEFTLWMVFIRESIPSKEVSSMEYLIRGLFQFELGMVMGEKNP